MPSEPTVLNAPGIFAPTPKYYSSAAMVLDQADGWDDTTGDVEWNWHIAFFKNVSVEDALKIVSEYIATNSNQIPCEVGWCEAHFMIDLLSTGRNWLVYTTNQGLVDAAPYCDSDAAQTVFDMNVELYGKWCDTNDV